jgi:4,5-dihydroxyphthalate decarboxylase
VFLSKAFLWFQLYANSESGITTLADLRGKRVAVPDYPMTAAVWMRSFFKELYGINTNEIIWYNGRTKEFSHSGVFGLDREPPGGITLKWLDESQTLDQMLERGEIDCAYGVKSMIRKESSGMKPIDRNGGTPIDGNPRIRPLFKDGGRQITLEYFRKTGVLPSNHMVIVKNSVLEKNPWAALELFKTFQRSKELSYEWASEMSRANLLFEGEDLKKQSEIYGPDPYPLGLRANRKMLDLLARCSVEQGLTQKPANIDELFFPSVRDT